MFGINYSDFEDGVAQLKACFSFCFIGFIANVFAFTKLFFASRGMAQLPMPMGLSEHTVCTALGGVALFCYVIGVYCGLTAFPVMFKNNAPIKDELKYHTGAVFQIIGIIVATAVVPLTYMTADGVGEDAAPMFSDTASPGINKVDVELKFDGASPIAALSPRSATPSGHAGDQV